MNETINFDLVKNRNAKAIDIQPLNSLSKHFDTHKREMMSFYHQFDSVSYLKIKYCWANPAPGNSQPGSKDWEQID